MEARAEIAPALAGNRDLLYLDVALENSIRGAAERGVGSAGRLILLGASAGYMQWLYEPVGTACILHVQEYTCGGAGS